MNLSSNYRSEDFCLKIFPVENVFFSHKMFRVYQNPAHINNFETKFWKSSKQDLQNRMFGMQLSY